MHGDDESDAMMCSCVLFLFLFLWLLVRKYFLVRDLRCMQEVSGYMGVRRRKEGRVLAAGHIMEYTRSLIWIRK